MAAGRTAVGARKAALAKGRRKREFMLGDLEFAGQRAAVGVQLIVWSLREGELRTDEVFEARGDDW
jgi:hypothetical protein